MNNFEYKLQVDSVNVDESEEIQNKSYKISNASSKSIFTDVNLSSLISQTLKHPVIELQTKCSIDFIEYNTTYLSDILNTCSGRDKFLAIIQFGCGCYSEFQNHRNNLSNSKVNESLSDNLKQVSENLSSGRKVFRLLKFSDELSNIIKYTRSSRKTTLFQDLLFYLSGVCSFVYYLLDNVIWLSSKKYKFLSRMKDLFSLARCVIEIWKCLHEIANDLKNEVKILKKLGLYDNYFVSDTEESYELIRDLIKLRRQMSFYVLDLVTNIFRTIMLVKSLNLYGSVYLDIVFIEFCGVISNLFALFKTMLKRSIIQETSQINDCSNCLLQLSKPKMSSNPHNIYLNQTESNRVDFNRSKFVNTFNSKFGMLMSDLESTQDSSSNKSSYI